MSIKQEIGISCLFGTPRWKSASILDHVQCLGSDRPLEAFRVIVFEQPIAGVFAGSVVDFCISICLPPPPHLISSNHDTTLPPSSDLLHAQQLDVEVRQLLAWPGLDLAYVCLRAAFLLITRIEGWIPYLPPYLPTSLPYLVTGGGRRSGPSGSKASWLLNSRVSPCAVNPSYIHIHPSIPALL